MSLYESFDFSEGLIEVAKIAFSLGRVYGRIFLEFEGIFFAGFFLGVFFSQAQEKNTPGKNPAETQSMKTQIKLGDIPVRKNVGKFMQNVGSRRLTPKSTKMTCQPKLKTQNSIIINKVKDLKR